MVFNRTGTEGLRSALGELFRRLAHRTVPELMTLGRTLDRWLPEIIAYFETGTTNAATEGFNLRSWRRRGGRGGLSAAAVSRR